MPVGKPVRAVYVGCVYVEFVSVNAVEPSTHLNTIVFDDVASTALMFFAVCSDTAANIRSIAVFKPLKSINFVSDVAANSFSPSKKRVGGARFFLTPLIRRYQADVVSSSSVSA